MRNFTASQHARYLDRLNPEENHRFDPDWETEIDPVDEEESIFPHTYTVPPITDLVSLLRALKTLEES